MSQKNIHEDNSLFLLINQQNSISRRNWTYTIGEFPDKRNSPSGFYHVSVKL